MKIFARFDTRDPAPLSVRWARVIVPLILCFAYLTLRVAPAVHERIPLLELLTSGVLFVGLTFVAFIALGDVIDPAPLPPRLENDDTTTFAATIPVEDAFDWGRIEGDLLAALEGAWPGRAEAKAELIKRAYGYDPADAVTEELELFTHEYVPQHHTPARGFSIPVTSISPTKVEVYAGYQEYGTVTGRIPTPEPRTAGRHRAKD